MALRDVMGGAARLSADFWTEVARTVQAPPQSSTSPSSDPSTSDEPELTDGPVESGQIEDTAAEAAPTEATTPPPAEPAGVLVPVDAWTRVLDQLGNLHQAGQDLAAARERAARAETQVEFLKAQLADAKSAAKPRPRPPRPAPATPAPAPAAQPPEHDVIDLRRPGVRIGRVRNRVGAWISTS